MERLRKTPVTIALLLFIAILFKVEWSLGGPPLQRSWEILINPIEPGLLVGLGAITDDALQHHQYWRLFSAMFLHINIAHWFLNSLAIYQLGSIYELEFGSRRFSLVYFATGLFSSIVSAIHLPAQGASAGASGAVLGVLGALIMGIQRSHLQQEPWARFLKYQLIFWAIVNVTLPLFVPIIDNWAHCAGVASGLILGFLLTRPAPQPPREHVVDVLPYDE